MGNLRPRLCCIDLAITWSMWQGQGFRFPPKTECLRLISTLLCSFLIGFCMPVISPWALQENNALALANQSMDYIGYKCKSCNKVLRIMYSKINYQKTVRNMKYLFLLPQSMLDKLESCGKLSLPHCTLAKMTAAKKKWSYNNEYSQAEVSSTITPTMYMLQYTKSQIQSAKQVLKEWEISTLLGNELLRYMVM